MASSTSAPPPQLRIAAGAEATIPIRRRSSTPSIDLTVRLMYAGAALSALAVPAELHARGDIRAALVRQNLHAVGRRLTPQDITDAASFTVSFMVTAAVLSTVLWLGLCWAIARGSRAAQRARLVGTVLAVLCVLKVYGTVTQGGTSTVGILVDLMQLAVALAVTVLMWSGRSATHFELQPHVIPDRRDARRVLK